MVSIACWDADFVPATETHQLTLTLLLYVHMNSEENTKKLSQSIPLHPSNFTDLQGLPRDKGWGWVEATTKQTLN